MTSSQKPSNTANYKTNHNEELTQQKSSQERAFEQAFDQLISDYLAASNPENQGLLTYFESDWLSPCVEHHNSEHSALEQDQIVNWQPVIRDPLNNNEKSGEHEQTIDLSNLESALELSLPVQVHVLFCRYCSHDINASAPQGELTLLQAWNDEDFDRLQKNLIAHVLMKRRLKQADTLFFALTDKDDMLLSVLVETGEVVLEIVGKEPHEVVSPDLTSFIQTLKPRPVLVTL